MIQLAALAELLPLLESGGAQAMAGGAGGAGGAAGLSEVFGALGGGGGGGMGGIIDKATGGMVGKAKHGLAAGFSNSPGEAMDHLSSAVGGLPDKFYKLGEAVVKHGEQLLESQRSMARFNSTTAQSFADLDRGRISRSYTAAAGQSESSKELADSMNRLEETLHPYQIELTNLLNEIASFSVNVINATARMADMIPLLGDYVREQREKNQKEGLASAGKQMGEASALGERMSQFRPPIQVPRT